MFERCCLLLAVLLCAYRAVHCGYEPKRTPYSAVVYNDSVSPADVFPDYSSTPSPSDPCPSLLSGVSYFLSEINIRPDSGNVLIGAADELYLLSSSLECIDQYTWNADSGDLGSCRGDNTGSDQERTCQNHIRVYESIPSDPTLFLVCGTQASVSPECRTVRVSDTSIVSVQGPITATDAIISFYPEFQGFGEFITETSDQYFGIGFFQGDRGVGRDYRMAFYDVQSPADSSFSITDTISTVVADTWLKPPVTFVDYYRADYAPPTNDALVAAGKIPPNPQPYNYQFYFVFIRESRDLDGAEVTYSQLVRICRNDPGVNGHFSTYMKARIFCMIEVPPGRDFIGANDFIYENIDSVAFNEEGRYSELQEWHKSMYGAFSGPRIGPDGTAICIYPAHNSREVDPNALLNRGIFDIFREDLLAVNGMEKQNTFVECEAEGRSADNSMIIDINQDVKQIGQDPLLVLDGITVTKMVVDSACVVTSTDSSVCLFQDILFLGTDSGTIIGVVFASVVENSQNSTTPVFFDEITLENNDRVRDLRLEGQGADKRLYVSTDSRIYRLPLQRCSRYQSCSACMRAQNPYCAWNSGSCVPNPITTTPTTAPTAFPSGYYQNVHTGIVEECDTQSSCSVTATPLSSTEFICEVSCDDNGVTQSVSFSSSDSDLRMTGCDASSLTLTNGEACARFTGGQGLQSYQCRVVATRMTGTTTFTASTTTSVGVPAPVMDEQIFAMSDRTSVEICIQLSTFTDYFNQYSFSVSYGSTSALGAATSSQSLSTGNCLTIMDGLTPGSTLHYRVTVMNSEGAQSSSIQTIQLLEDIPGVVTNLASAGVTATTVTLSWAQPQTTNGVITGYAVHIGDEEEISCVSLAGTSYTIDGLAPFTSTVFSVSACTEAGEGSLTSLTVMTSCAPPSAVTNPMYSAKTDTTLTISWGQPSELNGDPSGLDYDVDLVCYDPVNGVNNSPTSMNSATTSILISELKPLTWCCATIQAYHTTTSSCTDNTRGPAVEACDITTDIIPGMVQNLRLEIVGSTSLYASWSPPANYQRPGVTYTLNLVPSGRSLTLQDRTTAFFDGLDPSTLYTLSVRASSPLGDGMAAPSVGATTLPRPPLAPSNPTASLDNSGNMLNVSWDGPGANDPIVSSYTATLRCNDNTLPEQTVSSTSAVFDVSTISGLTWCTAVVQASNDAGVSEYSAQANAIRPATSPTKPTCFFAGNTGSNASISFTVTYPFSLNQLRINYRLYSSLSLPVESMEPFTINDPNIVFVVVERDTAYEFELQLCNDNDCGPFCDRIGFNTVTTTPSPPETINLVDSDCCSATVRWSIPPNEQEDMVSYNVQMTSSCTTHQPSVTGLRAQSHTFNNLCPNTEYSVAVQVTELQTNSTGVYGQPFMFTTIDGKPSFPRALGVILERREGDLVNMFVYWAVPETPNGTLIQYDLEWSSPLPSSTCGSYDSEDVVERGSVGSTEVQFLTNNTANIDLEGSILVCIRAKTEFEGEWAIFNKNIPTTAGLVTGVGATTETCTNLIVVAVIASLAVLSSIILGVVLILVVCYNGWTPIESKEEKDRKEMEEYSRNKRPHYNKSSSMMSTSSQAPMLRNGTISES